MHQIQNDSWIGDLKLNKISNVHDHQTRFSRNDNFCMPTIRSNIGRNSFTFMGPKIWAEIETKIKNLPLNIFKSRMTKLMIEQYHDEET